MRRLLLISSILASLILLALPAGAEVTETAVYKVRFKPTWSAQTHPTSFPPNPHFSGLIGGTHNGSVSFWKPGGIASPGMEAMAERGQTTPLDEEVQLAIDQGNALQIITGGGIANSPDGAAQAFFTVSQDHPLVTLVTMVAPSPDWFVGVQGLNLMSPSDWLEEKVVTLYAWDSGTDSGTSNQSGDSNTSPKQPISLIETGPLGNGVPLGTFTFTRQDEAEPNALELLDGRFHVSAEWYTHQLERGRARAVQLQDESGYLWFFSPGNIEVVVKVLDACSFNERFWVFAGGLTDVEVEMTVEDTLTGQVNVYSNVLGDKYQPIQDTGAFATCDVMP